MTLTDELKDTMLFNILKDGLKKRAQLSVEVVPDKPFYVTASTILKLLGEIERLQGLLDKIKQLENKP